MSSSTRKQPNLDPRAEIRRAIRECVKADHLSESAHMRLARLYWIAKATASPDKHDNVVERLDKATSVLADARQNFGDAVYQLEQLLK